MSPLVLLVTDRQRFEKACRREFRKVGLNLRTIKADELSGYLVENSVVFFDAASEMFDEDELLSCVGFAKALRAVVSVALPDDAAMTDIQELLDDLCPGLVARGQYEMGRIANKLARHYEHRLSNRFEYVTVSPRPKELLVILGDGTAVLVPRPLDQADDETDVLSISLSEESSTATLALASGKKITLDVRSIADSRSQKAFAAYANGIEKYEAQYGAILAARLKSLRQAAGLTQAELARRTGIHRPNIARVEAGRHTPSLETLTRLAAAIGVTPTSLFLDE